MPYQRALFLIMLSLTSAGANAADDFRKVIIFSAHAEQVNDKLFKITCRIENRGKDAVRVAVPYGDIGWEVNGESVYAGSDIVRVASNNRSFVTLPTYKTLQNNDGVNVSSSMAIVIEFTQEVSIPTDVRVCEVSGNVYVTSEASKSNDLKDAIGIDITQKIPIVRVLSKK